MKLRVFLPAADRIDETTPLAWLLFDARGAVLRSDTSNAAGIPKAGEVEAILPATRVLFARLELPKVSAATIRELLPYAVEDRLLADPANIHAVAGPTSAQGETLVAVVDREWLARMLATLRSAGLQAERAVCESALLAGGQGDWHAVLGADRSFLVDDDGVAVAFDRGASPDLPLAIRVALDEASVRGTRPSVVRLHSAGKAALPDLGRWSEQASVAFSAGDDWTSIAAAGLPRGAMNLMHGGFDGRPTGLAKLRIPRAAAWLAAAIVFLQIAFTAADAWRLSREHAELSARQEAVFRAAFPEAKAIVDPALQMTRNLSALKRQRGLAAEDDFLVQATRAARDFPAGSAKSLSYANGRIEVRRGERVAEARR